MQEHSEAVEADLLRFYDIDLRAGIGARRLRVLVGGLPPDSATARVLRDGTWPTNEQELLAALVKAVDFGNRLFYSAHKKKNAPDLKAAIIEPPGTKAERQGPRPQSGRGALKRMFGKNVKVVE